MIDEIADGPGRMEFGETVTLRAVYDHYKTLEIQFDIFGTECIVFNDMDLHTRDIDTTRTLSDEQRDYIDFISSLVTLTVCDRVDRNV